MQRVLHRKYFTQTKIKTHFFFFKFDLLHPVFIIIIGEKKAESLKKRRKMNEMMSQSEPHMYICFIIFQTIVSPPGNTDTYACTHTPHISKETTFIPKRSFFARIPSLFPAPHARTHTRAPDSSYNVLQK